MPKPPPRLCAAGVTLRNQVDQRWPKRDRASDGWIGDKAHQARASHHNPDPNGWVRALDIDADLTPVNGRDRAWMLADELREYAASELPGSYRILYIVYRGQITSGTYLKTKWKWRGKGYGHWGHIHVSFRPIGDEDGSRFPLPILAR